MNSAVPARVGKATGIAIFALAAWSTAAHAASVARVDRSLDGDGTAALGLELEVTDAVIDSEGRVVVAGLRGGHPVLARLGADAAPDPAFSGDGQVEDSATTAATGVQVEVLDDGSIRALVTDTTGASQLSRIDFAPDGTLIGRTSFESAGGIGALTRDGGAVSTQIEGPDVTVRRYLADGTRDPGFEPTRSPSQICSTPPTQCTLYFPQQVSVGTEGTIVATQAVSPNGVGQCAGGKNVLVLKPGASSLRNVGAIGGCGANDAFSIERDPRGRFLVSGWGGPPSKAQFIRVNADGSRDRSFGNRGHATSPNLDTDNLFVSAPAFEQSGAFINTLTEPREPTLSLSPTRFGADGGYDKGFASSAQEATFEPDDGLSAFEPHTMLLDSAGRITVVGTGRIGAGPVLALARWNLKDPHPRVRVQDWKFPQTLDGMASRGVRALSRCSLECRATLTLTVSRATARSFGLDSPRIGRGRARLRAGRPKPVRARLSARAERAFRRQPGRTVTYEAILVARSAGPGSAGQLDKETRVLRLQPSGGSLRLNR